MKYPKAKPISAFAVKCRGELLWTSIEMNRRDLVKRINRPSGESVVPVRISEVVKPKRKKP